MSTMQFQETTKATPEQFIAGLTDFGPGPSRCTLRYPSALLPKSVEPVCACGCREPTVRIDCARARIIGTHRNCHHDDDMVLRGHKQNVRALSVGCAVNLV
jgi:hypothetical protein